MGRAQLSGVCDMNNYRQLTEGNMLVNGKLVNNMEEALTQINRDRFDKENGVKEEESDGLKY